MDHLDRPWLGAPATPVNRCSYEHSPQPARGRRHRLDRNPEARLVNLALHGEAHHGACWQGTRVFNVEHGGNRAAVRIDHTGHSAELGVHGPCVGNKRIDIAGRQTDGADGWQADLGFQMARLDQFEDGRARRSDGAFIGHARGHDAIKRGSDARQIDLDTKCVGLRLGSLNTRHGCAGLRFGLVDALLRDMPLGFQCSLALNRVESKIVRGAGLFDTCLSRSELRTEAACIEPGQRRALFDPVTDIGRDRLDSPARRKAELALPARLGEAAIGFVDLELAGEPHRQDRHDERLGRHSRDQSEDHEENQPL